MREPDKEGHIGLWPAFVEKSSPLRRLAFLSGDTITTEDGLVIPWETREDIEAALGQLNLIILAEYIEPVVLAMIEHPQARISCSKDGTHVHAISVRIGRRVRHIVPANVWHVTKASDLQTVRAFLNHCQVGDRMTPASTGAALARQVWAERGYPRHRMPSKQAQKRIQKHRQPARCETFTTRWEGKEAYEYDLKNAYGRHYGLHPTGSTFRIIAHNSPDKHLATWFQRCIVTIKRPVPLSPFGVKRAEKWTYPTEPGVYGLDREIWLWKEQAERCRDLGMRVKTLGGYGWEMFTSNNKRWADLLMRLRATAPSPQVAGLVKKALVGGIGQQDVAGPIFSLVHDEPEPGDKPVFRTFGEGSEYPLTGLYTRQVGYSYGSMSHWAAYTVMRCNLTVFDAAVKRTEHLIQMNFDGLIFSARARLGPRWGLKHTHHDVIIKPRFLISREARRTPGIPHTVVPIT